VAELWDPWGMSKERARARAKTGESVTEITPKAVRVTSADVKRAQEEVTQEQADRYQTPAYHAAHLAMLTKIRYRSQEERAVTLGREEDVSWDVLGGWLTVPGETLRRRYGE
jgi:hypothetical protein